MMSFLKRALPALAVLTVLAGCYLPDKFVSEIRIGKTGGFAITYQGNLVHLPTLADLKNGKVTVEQAAEKMESVKADLRRETFFRVVEDADLATLSVDYMRQGVIGETGQLTFVRRNADIFSLKASKDGLITLSGNSLSQLDARRMFELGINTQGELRFVTDAEVLEHNAESIKEFQGFQVYIWKFDSALSASPRLVMKRESL